MLKRLILVFILLTAGVVYAQDEEPHWLEAVNGCEDQTCAFAVLLEQAAITLPLDNGYVAASPELLEAVPSAIEAFKAGDIATAIATYEAMEAEGYTNPMMFYSLGLLHEANGDTETALDYYNKAIEEHGFESMFYLSRALLYMQMEEMELATLDIWMMASADDESEPTLTEAIAEMKAELPIDTAAAEEWTMYPMYLTNGGVAQVTTYDATTVEPQTLYIIPSEDRLILFLEVEEDAEITDGDFALLTPNVDIEDTFTAHLRNYWGEPNMGEIMSLTLVGDMYTGSYTEYVFEGLTEGSFWLLPAGEEDPRVDLPRCEGGFAQRLQENMTVTTPFPVGTYTVYAAPGDSEGTDIEVDFESSFLVLEGPECVEGIAWWKLDSAGEEVWIPESNSEGQYLITPAAG